MTEWKPELTPSFAPSEMACKCGKCDGSAHMDGDFMGMLQALRDQVGPLSISSGYRCAEHPEEKRKDKPGAHNQGTAADIKTSDGGARFKIIAAAMNVGMVGLGTANSFIHVDSGHKFAPRPSQWKY